MTRTISAYLLPSLVTPEQLAGRTVVVIDVLRAGTTITHALASGAARVIPCLEVADALRVARGYAGNARVLLGGERGGLPIDGFDLGNSPAEYTGDKVAGATVVFSTTNGTRAMLNCRMAQRVLIGAFVNFSALCQILATEPHVDLLCAGTNQEITREDVLLAGALADECRRSAGGDVRLNDQAEIAADAWLAAAPQLGSQATLAARLAASCGGRNLLDIGQHHDIEIAATIDRLEKVPELDVASWCIR